MGPKMMAEAGECTGRTPSRRPHQPRRPSTTPGPSTPTKTPRMTAPRRSHAQLRGTPSARWSARPGTRRAQRSGYQASSDVPPNDAAAAEISTSENACRVEKPGHDEECASDQVRHERQRTTARGACLGAGSEEWLELRHQEPRRDPEVEDRPEHGQSDSPGQHGLQIPGDDRPVTDAAQPGEQQIPERLQDVDRQHQPGDVARPPPAAGQSPPRQPGEGGDGEVGEAPARGEPAPCRGPQALDGAFEEDGVQLLRASAHEETRPAVPQPLVHHVAQRVHDDGDRPDGPRVEARRIWVRSGGHRQAR